MDEFFIRPIRGMRAVLFGDDETDTTQSPSRVIRRMLFGRFSVARIIRQMGTEHDAIGDGDGTQLQWSPQVSMRHQPRLRRDVLGGGLLLGAKPLNIAEVSNDDQNNHQHQSGNLPRLGSRCGNRNWQSHTDR